MNYLNSYLKDHDIVRRYRDRDDVFAHLSVLQETLLLMGYVAQQKEPIFIVKENDYQASQLLDSLARLAPELRVVYYNHEESLRVETIVQSEIMQAKRIEALYKILTNDFDICITHALASVRKISAPEVLKSSIQTLKVGDDISLVEFSKNLHEMGYQRVKYVEKPFTYAMRGGVCDVFSIQMEKPLRIEFFDTEIENMRYFDIATQRSDGSVDEAVLVFARETMLMTADREAIAAHINNAIVTASDDLRNAMEVKREQILDGDYDGTLYPMLSYWDNFSTFYDYIADNRLVISPRAAVVRSLKQSIDDIAEFLEESVETETMTFGPRVYADFETVCPRSNTLDIHEFQVLNELALPWHQANIVSDSINESLQWIRTESQNHRVIITLDETTMTQFIDSLLEADLPYTMLTDNLDANGIYLDYSEVDQGYILDDARISVYTVHELYQFKKRRFRYDDKFAKAEFLNELQDLDTSDYVVHRQYGIGRYMGIITREIDGVFKDFMRIVYRDNDELFVPLEQFTLVRKYMSSQALAVRLSKLGSGAWQKSKERVEASIALVADKLIDLYSQRMEVSGYAYQADTDYQHQFEAEFPYELTPDQDTAVREIKVDMEKAAPMDRLLIGDVGFGKTEVAIRAAFKAFVDHKQVVFLCPTTILSAQHARTFRERFANYPIVVEVLNRFVSESQQREILKRVALGQVDVLIGTHRVLSQDVRFKDLGLLIIDEEQRFGVEHKERMKTLKVNVDVLSLSATPIPRTLQMSLIGLRSLSQLNTPPSNRLPVMTYVIEKNRQTIYDIISKEINRGGQVFYLFNNVEHIYGVANDIAQHLPDVRVAVVHGQMDRNEIEDVMLRFIRKEVNTLVCTTIIETGIDIPNANTILVDNAHRFGLSQLYQIKGRVGRSDRLAYAYFMIPSKKNLTEVAHKRLQAIKEFTQLGSGYKIAMRDLTIRGAGELLGGNQSGFIDTVGIDLYVQLLKEAIQRRRGEVTDVVTEDPIALHVDGYLPEAFADDDTEKLELYQMLVDINTFHDFRAFSDMLRDRYGELPSAVTLLLEKKRLELLLSDPRIDSFKERSKRFDLVFTEEYSDRVDGIHLFELVSNQSTAIKIKYVNRMIMLQIPFHKEWAHDLIVILEKMKEA